MGAVRRSGGNVGWAMCSEAPPLRGLVSGRWSGLLFVGLLANGPDFMSRGPGIGYVGLWLLAVVIG